MLGTDRHQHQRVEFGRVEVSNHKMLLRSAEEVVQLEMMGLMLTADFRELNNTIRIGPDDVQR